jgi:hypothetical protein
VQILKARNGGFEMKKFLVIMLACVTLLSFTACNKDTSIEKIKMPSAKVSQEEYAAFEQDMLSRVPEEASIVNGWYNVDGQLSVTLASEGNSTNIYFAFEGKYFYTEKETELAYDIAITCNVKTTNVDEDGIAEVSTVSIESEVVHVDKVTYAKNVVVTELPGEKITETTYTCELASDEYYDLFEIIEELGDVDDFDDLIGELDVDLAMFDNVEYYRKGNTAGVQIAIALDEHNLVAQSVVEFDKKKPIAKSLGSYNEMSNENDETNAVTYKNVLRVELNKISSAKVKRPNNYDIYERAPRKDVL